MAEYESIKYNYQLSYKRKTCFYSFREIYEEVLLHFVIDL